MKNFNLNVIKNSFNSKEFKYGGYSTLMIIIVIGIIIIANLILEQIPLKFDLSENKLFSLSGQTNRILKDLDREVTIYGLYEAGREDSLIVEILKKYREHSNKITLKFIDPNKNPGFIKQYTKGRADNTISTGSLIVVSGNKFKVIDANNLFNYIYDEQTLGQQATSLAAEQRITGAIKYVNNGRNLTIYALQGHGEVAMPYEIVNQLEIENYTLKDLTLQTGSISQDTDILLINAPKNDLTGDEVNKIRNFLVNQGRAIFLVDSLQNGFTNLQSVLGSYGIALEKQLVIEGDSSKNAGNPVFLLPALTDHQITNSLISNNMPLLIPAAQSIKELAIKKNSTEIQPLLVTSERAWAKTNMQSTSLEKDRNDPSGPFEIALAITDRLSDTDETKKTKLVVVANTMFLSSEFIQKVPGNANFFMNSLNWLQDRDESLPIQPKSLFSLRLQISSLQMLIFSGIVVIIIPLIILGMGLMVWLRRRNL